MDTVRSTGALGRSRSMSSPLRLVDPHGELVTDGDSIEYLTGV
jgi:hypothetical protein